MVFILGSCNSIREKEDSWSGVWSFKGEMNIPDLRIFQDGESYKAVTVQNPIKDTLDFKKVGLFELTWLSEDVRPYVKEALGSEHVYIIRTDHENTDLFDSEYVMHHVQYSKLFFTYEAFKNY